MERDSVLGSGATTGAKSMQRDGIPSSSNEDVVDSDCARALIFSSLYIKGNRG